MSSFKIYNSQNSQNFPNPLKMNSEPNKPSDFRILTRIPENISFDAYTIQEVTIGIAETENIKKKVKQQPIQDYEDYIFRLEFQSLNPIILYQVWNRRGIMNNRRLILKYGIEKYINMVTNYNSKNKVKFTPTTILDFDSEQYCVIIKNVAIENGRAVFYIYRSVCISSDKKLTDYNNNTVRMKMSIDSLWSGLWNGISSAARSFAHGVVSAAGDVGSALANSYNDVKHSPALQSATAAFTGLVATGTSYLTSETADISKGLLNDLTKVNYWWNDSGLSTYSNWIDNNAFKKAQADQDAVAEYMADAAEGDGMLDATEAVEASEALEDVFLISEV